MTQCLIAGTGRIGTAVSYVLTAAGVSTLNLVDPQTLSGEDLTPLPHVRQADIGKPKAEVLEDFLQQHSPGTDVRSVHAGIETPTAQYFFWETDLIVIASNTPESRLAADAEALRLDIPVVSVAVSDAREALRASITVRLPQITWHACQRCYFRPNIHVPRGEHLLPSVVSIAASHAAHLVMQIAAEDTDYLNQANFFVIDCNTHHVEAFAIERHPACPRCGSQEGKVAS